MENLKKEIGNRLKQSRAEAGFTQLQVAEKLNMTQQQYSRFENGIYELDYKQIVTLCRLYKISADYLFNLNDF